MTLTFITTTFALIVGPTLNTIIGSMLVACRIAHQSSIDCFDVDQYR